MLTRLRSLPAHAQFGWCIALVLLVAGACGLLAASLGHRFTALVLLMTVSLLAMLFETWPVLVAATTSALVWNFFFIPPIYTFRIGTTEDGLMFVLYFVVALVNAVLMLKIREAERRARDKEEKERSIALYNTLLNSLSHELRTPIATIVGAVDTLRAQENGLSATQRTELLAAMDEAGARLDRQVGNLLHMGRLESGMLVARADWCDVNEVVGTIVHELAPVQHTLVFQADAGTPLFKLDGGLLEQVVHNLLLNACQHTPPGTSVHINVVAGSNLCIIRVSDDGPGLSDTDRTRVFEKFHRAAGARTGGTGLGLSIVRGFVGAMGGTVEVEAIHPHGSLFTVRIPTLTSHLDQLNHD